MACVAGDRHESQTDRSYLGAKDFARDELNGRATAGQAMSPPPTVAICRARINAAVAPASVA